MFSSLETNLRIYLRFNSSNKAFWLLFSIFTRLNQTFRVGKRSLEFIRKKKKILFGFFCLEMFKFKTNYNRDILIVFLIKKNPINLNLWLQLFLDKTSLGKKIYVLRSALFFFPKSRFLMDFITLIFGLEMNMKRKFYFFLNRILIFLDTFFLNLKNFQQNFKLLKILCKLIKLYPFFLKQIHFSTQVKKLSQIFFEEAFISTNFFKRCKFDDRKLSNTLLKFDIIGLIKLRFLKCFKIKKKSDRDILKHSGIKIYCLKKKKINFSFLPKKINNVINGEKFSLIRREKKFFYLSIMKNFPMQRKIVGNYRDSLLKKLGMYPFFIGFLCFIVTMIFKGSGEFFFYPHKSKIGLYDKHLIMLNFQPSEDNKNDLIWFRRVDSNFEFLFN